MTGRHKGAEQRLLSSVDSSGAEDYILHGFSPGRKRQNGARERFPGGNEVSTAEVKPMPLYEYECQSCHKIIEVQQKMTDAPLADCPECHSPVKKIMSRNSFQLKGGGWYADGYASSSAKTADACPAAAGGGGCSGCPAAD